MPSALQDNGKLTGTAKLQTIILAVLYCGSTDAIWCDGADTLSPQVPGMTGLQGRDRGGSRACRLVCR